MNNQSNVEQQDSVLELCEKYKQLEQEMENLGLENSDLEMLVETITEHADFIEVELEKRNKLIRQIFGSICSGFNLPPRLGLPGPRCP